MCSWLVAENVLSWQLHRYAKMIWWEVNMIMKAREMSCFGVLNVSWPRIMERCIQYNNLPYYAPQLSFVHGNFNICLCIVYKCIRKWNQDAWWTLNITQIILRLCSLHVVETRGGQPLSEIYHRSLAWANTEAVENQKGTVRTKRIFQNIKDELTVFAVNND